MLDITVVVPVGPQTAYRQFLLECLDSIYAQAEPPREIIIINDMADLKPSETPGCTVYKNDWLLGCADSWNRGVALSKTDAVFLMGSDDKLLPGCLIECWKVYQEQQNRPAWYNVTCQIQDGSIQWLPNNAAMITKKLWNLTGGFPPSSFAAPDALLLSIMMVHCPERI